MKTGSNIRELIEAVMDYTDAHVEDAGVADNIISALHGVLEDHMGYHNVAIPTNYKKRDEIRQSYHDELRTCVPVRNDGVGDETD